MNKKAYLLYKNTFSTNKFIFDLFAFLILLTLSNRPDTAHIIEIKHITGSKDTRPSFLFCYCAYLFYLVYYSSLSYHDEKEEPFEPRHDKTNKMNMRPAQSDQSSLSG